VLLLAIEKAATPSECLEALATLQALLVGDPVAQVEKLLIFCFCVLIFVNSVAVCCVRTSQQNALFIFLCCFHFSHNVVVCLLLSPSELLCWQ